MIIEESKLLKKKLKNILEKESFADNFNVIDVNNDKPFTFTKKIMVLKKGNQFTRIVINLEKVVLQQQL